MWVDPIFPPLPEVMMGDYKPRRQLKLEMPTMKGLGIALDPVSGVLEALSAPATAFITGKANENIAKQERKVQQLQIKGQNEQAAREFALLQAMKQVEPEQSKRNSQLLALYAVGGVAALISTYLLVSMARSKGK